MATIATLVPDVEMDSAQWKQAVQIVSDKAFRKFAPVYHARLAAGTALAFDRAAVKIDVDNIGHVQAGASGWYTINGKCNCKDATMGKAPDSWCKHRFAANIVRVVLQQPCDSLFLNPDEFFHGTETPDRVTPASPGESQGPVPVPGQAPQDTTSADTDAQSAPSVPGGTPAAETPVSQVVATEEERLDRAEAEAFRKAEQEAHEVLWQRMEALMPVTRPPLHTTPVTALPLRPISAIIADLSRPLPPACVATKPSKNTKTGKVEHLDYLHWQTVARLLDTYAPGWHGEITRLEIQGEVCRVTYRVGIPCAEGTQWREASGEDDEWGDSETTRYGNPSANAQANAFKRAAALFGVGQWLYDKKDDTGTALAEYLRQERQAALTDLGKALVAAGQDRAQALAWIKRQARVTTLEQIPLATLRTLQTTVCGQQEDVL